MSPLRDDGDESLDTLLTPLDGEAGPARRISRRKSAALVMAAVEKGAREAPARFLARRKRPPVWLMVGALLFTGAAAAAVAWRLARFEPTSEPEVTRSSSEPSRPTRAGAPAPPGGSGQTSVQLSNAPAPEDLLQMANELRARGRWKEAEALYLRVIQTEAAARPPERSTPPLREAGP